MNPFHEAFKLHADPGEFLDVLDAHFIHGRVISTDRFFLMCRPVWKDWPNERLLDAWEYDDSGDCWMCWDLSGDLKALKEIPTAWLQSRPFVGFHVDGLWKFTRSSRLLTIGKS
jgi:hypothetical protein